MSKTKWWAYLGIKIMSISQGQLSMGWCLYSVVFLLLFLMSSLEPVIWPEQNEEEARHSLNTSNFPLPHLPHPETRFMPPLWPASTNKVALSSLPDPYMKMCSCGEFSTSHLWFSTNFSLGAHIFGISINCGIKDLVPQESMSTLPGEGRGRQVGGGFRSQEVGWELWALPGAQPEATNVSFWLSLFSLEPELTPTMPDQPGPQSSASGWLHLPMSVWPVWGCCCCLRIQAVHLKRLPAWSQGSACLGTRLPDIRQMGVRASRAGTTEEKEICLLKPVLPAGTARQLSALT